MLLVYVRFTNIVFTKLHPLPDNTFCFTHVMISVLNSKMCYIIAPTDFFCVFVFPLSTLNSEAFQNFIWLCLSQCYRYVTWHILKLFYLNRCLFLYKKEYQSYTSIIECRQVHINTFLSLWGHIQERNDGPKADQHPPENMRACHFVKIVMVCPQVSLSHAKSVHLILAHVIALQSWHCTVPPTFPNKYYALVVI